MDALSVYASVGSKFLKGADLEFFMRVWHTDISIYRNRIEAIGFTNYDNVLDAGCGCGQWSVALAGCNKEVYATDISELRVSALTEIANRVKARNIHASTQSVENTTFESNFFDAIFSYSVIYFTDFRKTLAEMYRILKPGGKLYISTNGLGWYLHNLVNGHNSTSNFDSRQMAIDTIQNSLNYYASGRAGLGKQIIMPKSILVDTLHKQGFVDVIVSDDGGINLTPEKIKTKSFFMGSYFDQEGVYEILCTKSNSAYGNIE